MPSKAPHTVALVAKTQRVSARNLSRVAAALQKQIRRDFAPVWDINATVRAFPRGKDVPRDAWTVTIVDRIKEAEEMMSIHSVDERGKPYAEVTYGRTWTVGASHDLMEMLVDPQLDTTRVAPALDATGRQVKYSVQICDPCAANTYTIDGVTVADFTTPAFWSDKTARRGKYSHTGALTRPRQIVKGGYLSWIDTKTNQWVQRTWFRTTPEDRDLGPADATSTDTTGETSGTAPREMSIHFHVRMLQEAYRDQEPRLRSIRDSIEALIARFATPAH